MPHSPLLHTFRLKIRSKHEKKQQCQGSCIRSGRPSMWEVTRRMSTRRNTTASTRENSTANTRWNITVSTRGNSTASTRKALWRRSRTRSMAIMMIRERKRRRRRRRSTNMATNIMTAAAATAIRSSTPSMLRFMEPLW